MKFKKLKIFVATWCIKHHVPQYLIIFSFPTFGYLLSLSAALKLPFSSLPSLLNSWVQQVLGFAFLTLVPMCIPNFPKGKTLLLQQQKSWQVILVLTMAPYFVSFSINPVLKTCHVYILWASSENSTSHDNQLWPPV